MKTTPVKKNVSITGQTKSPETPGNKKGNKEDAAKQDRPYIPDEEFGGAGYRHSREGHPGQKGPQQGIEHRPLLDDGV